MPKILNTNGNVIINTKAWFERFDVIRYSASEPDREVALFHSVEKPVEHWGSQSLLLAAHSEPPVMMRCLTAVAGTPA